MKKGWEYKKLGEVCKTYAGGTPLKTCKEYYDGGTIPWLRSGEVCRKYIDSTELFITQKGMDNSSAKYYPVNTIVVAMYGATAAQVGILKIESTSNQAVCGILPNDRFVPEFLFYWFTYIKDFLASQAQGGAQPNISQVKIKNLTTPVPPLSEQKEIVEYLDSSFAKIDKLKENAAKNLEEAKALFQSALKDALEPKEGWEEKTLGEMVKDVKYGTSKPACADGAYTYLRMNNITSDGHLDLNDTKTISLDDKELEKCIVRKGDILFNRTNSYEHVGKTCVFTEETPMVIAGYIIRIRLKECLNPYYMNYFFNMKDTKAKLRKISVGAVHQSNINAKAVQTVVIPLPSLSEQQSIVSFLDSLNEKLNTLQQNYSRICDECDALKQAILRQVFE